VSVASVRPGTEADLGWPHEWDPIASNDHCTAQEPAWHAVSFLDDDGIETLLTAAHRVTEPYVRWGCGYACTGCAI
jgi:hypothetical protein